MTVTVITNPELGWDCVVGVYRGTEEEVMEEMIANEEHDDMLVYHESEV